MLEPYCKLLKICTTVMWSITVGFSCVIPVYSIFNIQSSYFIAWPETDEQMLMRQQL